MVSILNTKKKISYIPRADEEIEFHVSGNDKVKKKNKKHQQLYF